jgi:hypothetical protein
MPKSQAKKYFFREICAIISLTREVGFKGSNLGEFHRPRGAKNQFVTRGNQGCRISTDKKPLGVLILAL